MNALTYSLLSMFAQAGAPAAAPEGDAAAGAALAPPPPSADESAALEAAKEAAQAQAAIEAGQGETLNLLDLWTKLNAVEQWVIIILMILVVLSLALMAEKIFLTRSNSKKIKDFLGAFRKANSVEEAHALVHKLPASGIKSMFDAGMQEVRKTQDLGIDVLKDRDHVLSRVQTAMTLKQNEHVEELSSSMTFLASVGSNAPFIGLFGTVWGIMNSFLGIVASQSTSLVAVAPGIAGALLATAAGLVAAIPAVLIYNFTTKQIGKISGSYEDFAGEFVALVSRDLDRRGA